MHRVYFNGKFYAGDLNGVHRVADRLIREYDHILAAKDATNRPRATLFVPRGRRPQPELAAIDVVEDDAAHSQRWEQLRLPRLARDGVLVNLCNLAPLRHPKQILLIHDAQFLFPDSGYPLRQRLGYRLLVPRMAQASTTVLTVSDYSRQMLDLLHVAPRQRTRVLYNGADHILENIADETVINQLGVNRGEYVLIFGSPKAYKNVAVVFDAMRKVHDKVLVVVGSSRIILQSVGISPPEHTVFAGKVDDSSLRALYENAHCLAFPSRTEGFGLPPVEAMLCGCPVVVAPAGAIPEVCQDAVLYANVDDVACWIQAINALKVESLRTQKQAHGLERAKVFTWSTAGSELYSQIGLMVEG